MLNVIVIGGRLQDEGYTNGSTELEEVLIEAVDQAGYSPMQVRIRFCPYHADWQEEARRLHLLRLRYKLTREQFGIVVCAFSWGVGYGVTRFAGWVPWWTGLYRTGGLERFGLNIDSLVSCDGIYRHWWSIFGFQWRSVVGGHKIKFPPNGVIKNIYAFRQEKSRPMGQEPITFPPTKLIPWEDGELVRLLDYEHGEMDDAPEYHSKCVDVVLNAAQRFIPEWRKEISPATGRPDVPNPTELMESKLEQIIGS